MAARSSILKVSLRRLGPLLRSLGPACCFRLRAFSRLALCVHGRGGSSAMMLSECACIVAADVVVCVCGWDAAGNGIGDAGAVALAKALECGQCKLESLTVGGESA